MLRLTNIRSLIAAGFLILSVHNHALGASPTLAQIEIKKFRFSHHNELNFERLVLEFDEKGGSSRPSVHLNKSNSGKEAVVSIDKAVLVGAIPEASINESYSAKSHYFGPISINTEVTDGFSIRTFLKDSTARIDAFWLANPARLIVDVYPKDSQRAQGAHVTAPSRHVANDSSNHASSHKPRHRSTVWSSKEDVICFAAGAQVRAALAFELGEEKRQLAMTIDEVPSIAPSHPADGIICFPRSAQVVPNVTFQNREVQSIDWKEAPPLGKVEIKEPHSKLEIKETKTETVADNSDIARAPKSAPSTAASVWKKVPNAEQKLNKEADTALTLPEEHEVVKAKPKQASAVSPYEDNFNKNNPPPTLGKALIPPPGTGRTPSLASPGSLLPPLR